MLIRLAALLCLLLGGVGIASADDAEFTPSGEPGDTLSVSVVTFQPGTEYWERFGHNALLLRERTRGIAVTYNYGLFDFRQKNFFLNFARGQMQYRVAPNYLENDLAVYAEEGRWAREQRLNLTSAQRGWLRDYLAWNVQHEHRDYRYDYFLSNCSTKVRDALDRALGGALRRQLETSPVSASYRSEALRLISPEPLMMIGMDAALGLSADTPLNRWSQSFAPLALMTALRKATVVDDEGRLQPLVAEESELLAPKLAEAPSSAPDLRLPFAVAGILLAVLLLVLQRRRRNAPARYAFAALATMISLVAGLCGAILAALWLVTEHRYGWRNENLLLLNPLCLLLLPTWIASASGHWQVRQFSRRLSTLILIGTAVAAILHVIPTLAQANLNWWLLLTPIHAALAYGLRASTQTDTR